MQSEYRVEDFGETTDGHLRNRPELLHMAGGGVRGGCSPVP